MTSNVEVRINLDELDYNIINILICDAKRSYVDIAKELKVSSGTVFVRVKKMIDQNIIIGTRSILNYHLLGYKTTIFLNIKVNANSSAHDIITKLIANKHVVEATLVSGEYDILCKIVAPSTQFAGNYIENKIKPIIGIQSITTTVALDVTRSNSLLIEKIN